MHALVQAFWFVYAMKQNYITDAHMYMQNRTLRRDRCVHLFSHSDACVMSCASVRSQVSAGIPPQICRNLLGLCLFQTCRIQTYAGLGVTVRRWPSLRCTDRDFPATVTEGATTTKVYVPKLQLDGYLPLRVPSGQ